MCNNMSVNKFIILSSVLISLLGFHCSAHRLPYNRLTLVESWPRSECCVVLPTDPNDPNCHSCHAVQSISRWIIHGLWATHAEHEYTSTYCPNNETYFEFPEYPEDLLQKMRWNWPATVTHTRAYPNWGIQWKKYGSCTTDIEGMKKPQDYFNRSIELFETHNVGSMFALAKISHKQIYSTDYIVQLIHTHLRKKPGIACNNRGGLSYLYGIHFCFDKKFALTDCNYGNNCHDTVYYP